MSCQVKGYVLLYSTEYAYFIQVVVHLLIADYRKKFAVLYFSHIPLKYLTGNLEQGDTGIRSGLLPFGHNPQSAVKAGLDMFLSQIADVYVRQTRIATKNKHVTNSAQSLGGKLLGVNPVYLGLLQITTVHALKGEFIAGKGVCEVKTAIFGIGKDAMKTL